MYAHMICVSYTDERKVSRKFCSRLPIRHISDKGGIIAILCNNGTELKTVLFDACKQFGIETIFIPFHLEGNLRIENVHNFLKSTLTKFQESSDLEWDELLPFACYCYNIFPCSNGTEPLFFLMVTVKHQKAN